MTLHAPNPTTPFVLIADQASLPLLRDEFVNGYSHRKPNWGPVGEVVYLRTYSRFDEKLGRREQWHETVRRVVEHSFTLEPAGIRSRAERVQEAEALFDTIWNLRAFPSGRGLWVGGTEHSYNHPESLFNCAFTNLNSVEDYYDMVILLMSGAGVGFGVRDIQVERFASQGVFNPRAKLVLEPYEYVGTPGTLGFHPSSPTNINLKRYPYSKSDTEHIQFQVGDSREGWAHFAQWFLYEYFFGEHNEIRVNFNWVRPKGSPLKTFGGYASGPEPLMEFVEGVERVCAGQTKITSIMLLDIANLIGRMVVAGGTRRSAQIGLGNPYDQPYTAAKTGEWWKDFGWRNQSNNSVVFYEKPTAETLTELLQQVIQYGEPGFINGEAALARRADWQGLNPCAEILLPDGGFCNLTTVNLGHYAGRDKVDALQLESDTRLVARHNVRVTNVTMTGIQPKWDRNQKQDRLMGVSFTGYGDLADAKGEDTALTALANMRRVVNQEADCYSLQMGINRPLLATTVKPEGSISQLPGVSSGIHDAYAPYYLRRIRVSDSDAVGEALRLLGVPCEPDAMTPNTLVFTFPVKTFAKVSSAEKSAVDQLHRYFDIMETYVDHNASNTISFSEDEIPEIVKLLLERWDDYVAVSFLPKAPGSYPQMPYEAITEEQFKSFPRGDLSQLAETISILEGDRMTGGDDLEGCSTGACPIR